jgi:hypothetical protein
MHTSRPWRPQIGASGAPRRAWQTTAQFPAQPQIVAVGEADPFGIDLFSMARVRRAVSRPGPAADPGAVTNPSGLRASATYDLFESGSHLVLPAMPLDREAAMEDLSPRRSWRCGRPA